MNVTSKTQSQESLWSAAEDAAQTAGVRVYNLRENGKGIAFTLKTVGEKPKYRRINTKPLYRNDGRGVRTLPGRVCWHGFRDFLRTFFSKVPDARVRTAMATYRGARDFEQSFGKTFYKRSEYMGMLMEAPKDQACGCQE